MYALAPAGVTHIETAGSSTAATLRPGLPGLVCLGGAPIVPDPPEVVTSPAPRPNRILLPRLRRVFAARRPA